MSLKEKRNNLVDFVSYKHAKEDAKQILEDTTETVFVPTDGLSEYGVEFTLEGEPTGDFSLNGMSTLEYPSATAEPIDLLDWVTYLIESRTEEFEDIVILATPKKNGDGLIKHTMFSTITDDLTIANMLANATEDICLSLETTEESE